MGIAAALADKVDTPAGAADARHGQRRAGRWRDPPAGDRRGRRGEGIDTCPAPAAQQQGGGAAFLRRQLQPAGGGHVGTADLAHHRGQTAMAQGLFHHRLHFLIPAALGVEHIFRPQADQGEAGGEQIAGGHRPQNGGRSRSFRLQFHRQACGGGGQEQGGGSVIRQVRPGARCLVQHAAGQTSAGEASVHRLDAEW